MNRLITIIVILAIFIPVSFTGLTASNAYYVSLTGDDTNSGTIDAPWRSFAYAVSRVEPGDTLYIRGGVYNERLQVYYDGGGSAGNYVTYAAYPGEQVSIDGTNIPIQYGEGMVNVKMVKYVRITGLHVEHSNGAGIYAAYASNITIDHNFTYDTVKSGIGLWGMNNSLVDSNDVSLACVEHPGYISSEEPITVSSGVQVEVKNNKVHDGPVGQNPPRAGGEGINTKDNSHFVYVHHNEVYNLIDKVGLSVDAWGGDLSDVYIYDNLSHDNFVGLTFSDERNIQPGVSNVHIYNNLIYNNSRFGVYIPNYMENGPLSDSFILHNTVVNNGVGIQIMSDNATNIVIRNNIIWGNDVAIYQNPASIGDYIIDHNLEIDPLFVDGYHLSTNSPAIDAGVDAGIVDDYDGNPRPVGAGFDIGAFEYQAAPVATVTVTPFPTATNTVVPSQTVTFTASPTSTFVPTVTNTATITPRRTPTRTPECVDVRFKDGSKIIVCKP